MNINDYQQRAKATAIYPTDGFPYDRNGGLIYTTLGLVNEAGEFAGKLKKVIRDNNGVITDEARKSLIGEMGDVCWYVAMVCDELDIDLADVFQNNLDKLESRKERGVLGGSGDNR